MRATVPGNDGTYGFGQVTRSLRYQTVQWLGTLRLILPALT